MKYIDTIDEKNFMWKFYVRKQELMLVNKLIFYYVIILNHFIFNTDYSY